MAVQRRLNCSPEQVFAVLRHDSPSCGPKGARWARWGDWFIRMRYEWGQGADSRWFIRMRYEWGHRR